MKSLIGTLLILLISIPTYAGMVGQIQTEWAHAMYRAPTDQRVDLLIKLADQARSEAKLDSDNAELLIWQGIVLSTLAGEKGGLGALSLAKEAKKSLEKAIELDPTAMDGSAMTSLGTLYHKIPGWPIGFGSDKKANALLEESLTLNPHGIDVNYFFGEFLYDEGDYADAKQRLLTAKQAAPRKSRPIADAGRHKEIEKLLALVEKEL